MMSSEDVKKTNIVLLDVMIDILVGEPDEKDLDKPTLQEILFTCDEHGKVMVKDYNIFLEYKKKILSILNELDTNLKRLGGSKASFLENTINL